MNNYWHVFMSWEKCVGAPSLRRSQPFSGLAQAQACIYIGILPPITKHPGPAPAFRDNPPTLLYYVDIIIILVAELLT